MLQGAGEDSDLIPGYARLRDKIAAAKPDVVMIFDSHWFTTGYHLVDGGERYRAPTSRTRCPGTCMACRTTTVAMPSLALEIEAVSREQGGYNRAVCHPDLGRHYATINLVKQLRLELSDTPVVTVSSCQNCDWPAFPAVGRSDWRGDPAQRPAGRAARLRRAEPQVQQHRLEAEQPAHLPREQCLAAGEHRERQGRDRS